MLTSPSSNAPSPGWEPAPADEIAQLGKRLRRRGSRRQFLRIAASAASVLATGGGVWLLWPDSGEREYDFAGIRCSEVVGHGKDYMAGRVPEPTRGQITAHVARCPHCGPLFKKMEAEMSGMG